MLGQLDAQAHGLPEALTVKFVLEVAVIEKGLDLRVSRREPQFPLANGQLDPGGHANPYGLHAIAASIDTFGGKGLHGNFHVVAEWRALRRIAQADLHSGRHAVQGKARLSPPGRPHERVVAEILADTGEIQYQWDAQARQLLCWSHP